MMMLAPAKLTIATTVPLVKNEIMEEYQLGRGLLNLLKLNHIAIALASQKKILSRITNCSFSKRGETAPSSSIHDKQRSGLGYFTKGKKQTITYNNYT